MSETLASGKSTQIPQLANETGWRSWLTVPQDGFNKPWMTFLLILIAWFVCALIRYQWIAWADGIEEFKYLGSIQPTTHDAFTHGAVLQQHLIGLHSQNPNIYPILNNQGALHLFSWLLLKFIPITIPTLLIWAPVVMGSMMVVPVVLIGRLFGSALWGFTAALLGGIAWNYYERTMAGYFDTDLFSFWIALFLAYVLMATHERCSLRYAGFSAIVLFLYPFFYAKGLVIGTGIAGCFIGLQVLCMLLRRNARVRLGMIALVAAGAAGSPWSYGTYVRELPWYWFLSLFAIIVAWVLLSRIFSSETSERSPSSGDQIEASGSISSGKHKALLCISGACIIWFLISMPWSFFFVQIETYSHFFGAGSGAIEQLDPVELKRQNILDEVNFRNTHKHTVLEARGEPFNALCQRIIGSVTGAIISLIGFILLCIRYPSFLICAPLAAIGLFSFDGGLRFTTWGGVVAAPALVYVLFIGVQAAIRLLPNLTLRTRRTGAILGGMVLAAPFIAINMTHAISFKVGPVFQLPVIEAMRAIQKASEPGDYVLSWWDYGSGLWYYSERNVLMSPISVTDDCWTIANMITSDSQQLAASLARVSAESAINGNLPSSHDYLKVYSDSPIYPQAFLNGLESGDIDLPPKTREVFLYIPNDMLRILSVIECYANPDYNLPDSPNAGVYHYIQAGTAQPLANGYEIMFNGIILDLKNLTTSLFDKSSQQRIPIEFKSLYYVFEDGETGYTGLRMGPKLKTPGPRIACRGGGRSEYRIIMPGQELPEGFHEVHLLILESTGAMVIVDDKYLNSNFIQMTVLQNFDKDLWKLVHKNGHARVFQLKDSLMPESEASVVEEISEQEQPAP